MLEGWELNSIITLQSAQPWGPIDLGTDAAGTGPLPVSPPANAPIRWSFYGKPSDFKSGPTGIPFFAGTSNAACAAQALAVDGGTPGASTASLSQFGCYAKGNSIMIPPPLGQFGNMGRNTVPRLRLPRTSISRSPRTGTWARGFGPSSAPNSLTFSTTRISPIRTADRTDSA